MKDVARLKKRALMLSAVMYRHLLSDSVLTPATIPC